jgi:hypothetical protein
MNRDSDGFLKSRGDEAVESILSEGRNRMNNRGLPTRERARVKKAKDKQAARKRAVYDLPEDLIDEVSELAKKHKVPASQVAMIALRYFLQSGVDISQFKVVTDKKSPLYDFRLVWFDSTSYEVEEK